MGRDASSHATTPPDDISDRTPISILPRALHHLLTNELYVMYTWYDVQADKKTKEEKVEERVTLGPKVAEGENVFGVAHIFASFNDTFVVSICSIVIYLIHLVRGILLFSSSGEAVAGVEAATSLCLTLLHCIVNYWEASNFARFLKTSFVKGWLQHYNVVYTLMYRRAGGLVSTSELHALNSSRQGSNLRSKLSKN